MRARNSFPIPRLNIYGLSSLVPRPYNIIVALLFAHAKIFTYSLSIRKRYPEKYTNLLVFDYMNVEHSDVRACTCTQGVYLVSGPQTAFGLTHARGEVSVICNLIARWKVVCAIGLCTARCKQLLGVMALVIQLQTIRPTL